MGRRTISSCTLALYLRLILESFGLETAQTRLELRIHNRKKYVYTRAPEKSVERILLKYLTHLPLVAHICVSESGQHWFRYWLVACSAPSHYLNQCWLIVNWTLWNNVQWNLNRYSIIFIQENAAENAVCQIGGQFCPGGDELNKLRREKWPSLCRLYFHIL